MNLPCDQALNCPGTDSPILNTSSEGVDRLLFGAIYYPPNPTPCLGLGCTPHNIYTAQDCHGVVYSSVSQLEADLLALAASVNCSNPAPNGTCYNDAQTASFTCPDGTVYSYTIMAGTVPSPNTGDEAACISAANAQALALAQQQIATFSQTCPGSPPADVCSIISTSPLPNASLGIAYSDTLSGTSILPNQVWALASGTLPPGMSLTPDGVIQGTPTTPGTYVFTVQLETS